jgi:hypothetical protein
MAGMSLGGEIDFNLPAALAGPQCPGSGMGVER